MVGPLGRERLRGWETLQIVEAEGNASLRINVII